MPNDLIYVQRSQAEEWNRLLRKIQPTLDTLQSALELKDSIFPIHGQLIPEDGWWGNPEGTPLQIEPVQ